MMFLRLVHILLCISEVPSMSSLSSTALYNYTLLFIHSYLLDIWVIFKLQVIINKRAINTVERVFLCVNIVSISLG